MSGEKRAEEDRKMICICGEIYPSWPRFWHQVLLFHSHQGWTGRSLQGDGKRGKCPPSKCALSLSSSVTLNEIICKRRGRKGATRRRDTAGLKRTRPCQALQESGTWTLEYIGNVSISPKTELCSLLKWLAPQLFEKSPGT